MDQKEIFKKKNINYLGFPDYMEKIVCPPPAELYSMPPAVTFN